MEGKTWVRNWG